MQIFDQIDVGFLSNQVLKPALAQIDAALVGDAAACTCRTCRRDLAAFVLSGLPAVYHGSEDSEDSEDNVANDSVFDRVALQRLIAQGIQRVGRNPHHG